MLSVLWPKIERTGSRAYELGDLANTGNWTLECKWWARWGWRDVAKWMDQAEAAQARTGTRWKGLLVKRNGARHNKGYLIIELDDVMDGAIRK